MALDFNPLDFFKEEIRNESAAIRIGAVNRLHLIASAMGKERAEKELLPFVTQSCQEDSFCNDEEFLFTVAKQLATLSPYIGDKDELLMQPLEHLAAQEETVIRDQAVASLCTIVERRPDPLVTTYLIPILDRLSHKNDFFTARVSACALFPTALKWTTKAEDKDKLRGWYVSICNDDTPMVRRAAAHRMREVAEVCAKEDFLNDLLNVYKSLSEEDTQDTIRVACVHTTLVLAKVFNQQENISHTVNVIKNAAEDRSWRVRLTVAKIFDQLCQAYGPEIRGAHLLNVLITLMKDHEQEVRKEALKIIEPCLEKGYLTSEQLQSSILRQFQSMAIDSSQPVRAALAQVMGPVAKTLGRELTQRQLLPLISDLMKDEFHDVRLNIVGHAGLICEVLSVDGLVHSLLHTIQSLIMDNHWRIRQSVVEQVPKLARLFGIEMFQSKLESLFLSSLRDSVHAVREAAITHLKEVSETFGAEWTVDHLVPKITEQYSQSAGYANRVTTLNVLPQLSHVMTASQIGQLLLPLLIKATKDTVPNVRFCACKTILWMMTKHSLGSQAITSQIKPALMELEHDPDIDVQYYAQRAMEQCGNQ
jgi:serine/threonine-protein phosphatase 2A regulatory subunit A